MKKFFHAISFNLFRKSESSNSNAWISADLRRFDKRSIIWMLVGVIIFGGGLAVDLSLPKYPEIGNALLSCQESAEKCNDAVRQMDAQMHGTESFSWWSFISATAQALGLTTVAAIFISSTVDQRTRTYFFTELARKTEALGSNVLLGMFEARHHPRLFKLVKEKMFERKLIRKNIDINYTLTDLEEDFSGTRIGSQEFVKVDVILSTVTENINATKTSENGRELLKVALALPNPMLDELKPLVRINSFRIGSDILDEARIGTLNEELQEKLKDDTEVDAPLTIGETWLEPSEQITVSGSYTMIKEAQDTEVFRSSEIAENIHLTVVDKSSFRLRVRARSLAHGKLHGQASPSAQQWKLDDLSLPLQGIMVWWKKAPNGRPSLAGHEAVPSIDAPPDATDRA